jgi:predicted enzyme related to lactoylglutathione lyase
MTNYVTVKLIDEYLVKIQQSGGQIMIPKTEIPDMGYFAILADTENNQFGLFEAKQ